MGCGSCERRMQRHWANSAPHCRCRSPAEYALTNRVEHPLNACLREGAPRSRMGEPQIETMITKLGDMAAVVRDADPNDKPEVCQQMGLKLTYQPGQKVIHRAIHLEAPGHWVFDGVRGAIRNLCT